MCIGPILTYQNCYYVTPPKRSILKCMNVDNYVCLQVQLGLSCHQIDAAR